MSKTYSLSIGYIDNSFILFLLDYILPSKKAPMSILRGFIYKTSFLKSSTDL